MMSESEKPAADMETTTEIQSAEEDKVCIPTLSNPHLHLNILYVVVETVSIPTIISIPFLSTRRGKVSSL